MKKYILLILILIMVISSCTSPPQWKGSPYLYKDAVPKHMGDLDLNHIPLIHDNKINIDKTVNVKIYSGKAKEIYSNRYFFRSNTGKIPGSGKFIPSGNGILITQDGSFRLGKNIYKGKLKIYKKGSQFIYVNVVSMEDYLTSVASHEMAPSWPVEALKAQVVVARTYYLKNKKSGLYNIDSTTNAQVYKGIRKDDSRVRNAVRHTSGEVITFHGKTASVFFHSCSGGRTASSKEVWGNEVSYLKSIQSNYCENVPVNHWTFRISHEHLKRVFHRNITDIQILSRTSSNRVAFLNLKTPEKNVKISGTHFRRKMGATKVKSTLFAIRKDGSEYIIAGKGYGHGVGMCQWSARIMAQKHGLNYRQIIHLFFPGTIISKESGNIAGIATLNKNF